MFYVLFGRIRAGGNAHLFGCCLLFACSGKADAGDVIGIDLGTTNSCVAIMEGKVQTRKENSVHLLMSSYPITLHHAAHVKVEVLIPRPEIVSGSSSPTMGSPILCFGSKLAPGFFQNVKGANGQL